MYEHNTSQGALHRKGVLHHKSSTCTKKGTTPDDLFSASEQVTRV